MRFAGVRVGAGLLFWMAAAASMDLRAADATPLRIGVGQTVVDLQEVEERDAKTGKAGKRFVAPRGEPIRKMTAEAVAEALQHYGAGAPKLLWVLERTSDEGAVAATVKAALPEGVPYIIDYCDWADYTPIGPKAVSSQKQNSVLAVALGGDVEIQTAHVKIAGMANGWEKDAAVQAREKARHAAWGEALAGEFDFTRPGTKIFFQMGNQHVPAHQWIFEGVKKVIPKDVHVVGGASAAWFAQNYGGKAENPCVYGILVSGPFKVAQAMSKRKDGVSQGEGLRAVVQAAKRELGAKPSLAVYWGCAGWNGDQANQYKVLLEELGDVPFFGRFNGGELGRYATDQENVADTNLASVLLVGSKP
jgi:hypothetical protein